MSEKWQGLSQPKSKSKGKGKDHKKTSMRSKVQQCLNGSDGTVEFVEESERALMTKFDQSTGEVLLAVACRDDRPIVHSGSVVSTCPVDYATSVPTEKVKYSTNSECVGRISATLRRQAKCSFTNRSGSSMSVNF